MDVRLIAAAIAGALFSASAQGQISVKGDAAKAKTLVSQVCSACHTQDGNSAIPTNPVIAGQHPQYSFKQLTNFKSEGGKPAARPSPIMTGIVAGLSRDDMANLAMYFGEQQPKPRTARDPELVKVGEQIYRGGIMKKGVPACASCHGANGAGIPAQFPRLAGQHSQYTADALIAFRAGTRTNDPNRMMRATAEKLSDQEIRALAQYIEGLR